MGIRIVLASICAALLTAAQAPVPPSGPPARDRASILAMAGDYRVRFDFREHTAFVSDYKPLAPTGSGGFEAVRVIEDRGDRISLQHILVVGDDPGPDSVVKHWRQDWVWQPDQVLDYVAANQWKLRPVPAAERRGAWSQTVWQTDDSPRYGGVGRWTYENGVSRWTSEATRRPLARRDAVRNPPYGWYEGVNRHALTPNGWVHEQDNAKIGLRSGQPVTLVQEAVVNTYARSTEFKPQIADDYWARTKDYWALVRAGWDTALRRDGGLFVREEPQNGAVTGPRLMGLADEIAEGKQTTSIAASRAQQIIAEENRRAGARAER